MVFSVIIQGTYCFCDGGNLKAGLLLDCGFLALLVGLAIFYIGARRSWHRRR